MLRLRPTMSLSFTKNYNLRLIVVTVVIKLHNALLEFGQVSKKEGYLIEKRDLCAEVDTIQISLLYYVFLTDGNGKNNVKQNCQISTYNTSMKKYKGKHKKVYNDIKGLK